MSVEIDVRRAGIEAVEVLEPLSISMVDHHREVAGGDWPVRASAEAWRIRQTEYRQWLTDESGVLFVASSTAVTSTPVCYAMLRVHEPGATWDLGAEVGEVESLAVTAAVRGKRVGPRPLEACRAELGRRGIRYWSVAVVEANSGAARLYERAGFRAYYRLMLGEVSR